MARAGCLIVHPSLCAPAAEAEMQEGMENSDSDVNEADEERLQVGCGRVILRELLLVAKREQWERKLSGRRSMFLTSSRREGG